MSVDYIINKDRILPDAANYAFLKQEGMKYIERLGNKLWTDYNAHDPGITILEVLSYVITELGYRSNFNINDLLTDKGGNITNGSFFSADSILTCAPLTEIDYRKLLIDIDGVSNAWFLSTERAIDADGFYLPNPAEMEVYINVLEDKLSFSPVNRKNEPLPNLHIRGLNKVFVELDEHPVYGDLNSTITEYEFDVPGKWLQVTIIPEFGNWNDPKTLLIEEMKSGDKEVYPVSDNRVSVRFSKGNDSLNFIVEAYDKTEIDDIIKELEAEPDSILELYEEKKKVVDTIFTTVLNTLQSNRNITEDYLEIGVINSWLISVCAKIDLSPQTNPVDVMAQVQMAIYGILNPEVKFYTLSQLVEEGYSTEDIFIGPNLQNGFLKDEDVVNSQLPTAIHTSDIIAAVMKIPGVASISNVLLTAYDERGTAISGQTSVPWCLHLPGNVRPTLNRKRSQIKLYQQGLPFFLTEENQKNIDQQISIYKSYLSNYKISKADASYPFPTGNYYNFDEYYSIQEDFPATYGLGSNELPQTVTAKRKAQVKQLKGYLYFYEQIVADFFSQLYYAKDLLDITTLKSSYYTDYLGGDSPSALRFDSRDLLHEGLAILYSHDGESGEALYESESTFHYRRNRALDHLIARFGESFNDYVFMMYKMREESNGQMTYTIDNTELIEDKQNFVASYPEISSKRALAMDYTLKATKPAGGAYTNYWDTSNIGGYATRVARLLGINIWPLQPYEYNNGKAYWTLNIEGEALFFYIIGPETDLAEKRKWVNENITDPNMYEVIEEKQEGSDPQYYIYMVEDQEKKLKIDKPFSESEEAKTFINIFLETLQLPFEYFYCLEHSLLRPFPGMENPDVINNNDPDANLLPVCLDDDCNCEANADPYSFKATIVFPGWLGRFTNIIFREYAEKILREQAPAHILLKVCWVGEKDMNGDPENNIMGFTEAYANWYDTYYVFRQEENMGKHDSPEIKKHFENHSQLLKAMKNLNTTYPAGHLYDCQTGETTSPIILGNSKLGNL